MEGGLGEGILQIAKKCHFKPSQYFLPSPPPPPPPVFLAIDLNDNSMIEWYRQIVSRHQG